MITFSNVTLRRAQHVLISELNWTIYHKQRIGLIGANGSGKTSLFAMLRKELAPDVGDLYIPNQLRMAHVEQETPALSCTALEFTLSGDTELEALEKELKLAEDAHDGMKMATIHEKMSIIDAYTAPARAAQLLSGLGFTQVEQQKKVSDFSGGWRVRLNLAKALMSRSDMLLLDEPTNHLDLDAVLWLEEWLKKYPGTLLLISHDREFLDHIVDHIAHISHQQLTLYSGNYSTFEKTHAEKLLLQQAAFEKQQKKIAHLQSFINRFGAKASKAKQAQSRQKAIARMDLVCAVQTESPFQFEFRAPSECPYPLLTVHDVKISYGDHIVLQRINFNIAPKERIAVLGPNGAGKTSFIKMLAGELAPTGGVREASAGLRIGYFAQHQVDHLKLNESPLEHMREISGNKSDLELRTFLGGFDFVGDRVHEPVKHFSGGEKSRLALAIIVWQKPNLLLLDEPTNHLDLEMRQALSLALQEYEGAMILVSHDRFLVRTTTEELLLIADKKLIPFDGDLDDYQKWLIDYRKQQMKDAQPKKEVKVEPKKSNDQLKALQSKIKKIETELATQEKKLAEVELRLSDNGLYASEKQADLTKLLQTQSEIKKKIEALEGEWLVVSEELK